ncbi:cyclase [Mycobacterium paragordonae]|uniref:AAA family ATPase n=1 Tax=Mycobacterium paragordonae TaxID=1389713 RepID=UPI00105B257F|nr:adenylate/guanylate cyclase domain-containing protein [Mycobacterium paragordonae]TDK86077.1 cyclase [Mycobacterium paragordonae]TDK99927.1 cyclase [Mycobacterium paragordonae]
MTACGSCGNDMRANARFCDQCGTATLLPAETANYKQVTVLFADVVRSMDLAANLDIERLREVMTELVQRSAAVVQRYGGTVEYTGDGVMALFGAPVALEDHALRGCLAALAIQDEAAGLAAEVARRDDVALQLRVGLHSGQVIAGEITLGYAATGETVGLAQRMESAAQPGGILLSESTVRLVEHAAVLGVPELVHIKGVADPVPARRLLAISGPDGVVARAEANLVGRRWEMAALDAMVERAIGGRGGVVTVVGPPGIGKSRVAREIAARAAPRGVEVYWTFCESHARDVSFGVVARLLRVASGVTDLGGPAARMRVRDTVPPDANPHDLLLLDDLLGIADPDVPLPQIDPEARRRRLTGLINSTSLARTEPALFVIEDAHWIDAVSESMLADFLTVIARTPSVVLITYRPEYRGTLTCVTGAQTIALAPLADSDTATLLGELLGSHPSVGELAPIIAGRAAGNPFFTEEMVRELVQRGTLTGERGGYVCSAQVAELSVPATVQAAIAARIDRLDSAARRTLNAASVIGARFDADLLAALGIQPQVDELVHGELIDQVRLTPSAEYAFRHPLIRAVAYESQLKADRADWHRRLAAAIESKSPNSPDSNAALIAEHLEAAGELVAAYGWQMRAGTWLATRDISAARVSWERARRIADALPEDHPDRPSMRITPRTMLCATSWQAIQETRGLFTELRELCTAAGDKVSLAIGMTGLETELMFAGQTREGSRLASEQMTLLASIDDPAATVGLAFIAFNNWFDAGEFGEILRWSDIVIALADGDPATGADFGFGSPLAAALAWRGVAGWWVGRPGWRQDVDAAYLARQGDPTSEAMITCWTYGLAITYGALRPDDATMGKLERAMQTAEGSSNAALSIVKYGVAAALLHRDAGADRERGLELMMEVRDIWLSEPITFLVPVAELWVARVRSWRGDHDPAVPVMRTAVDDLYRAGRPFFGVLGTGMLVETLLERGANGDLTEAEQAIERLANLRAQDDWAMRDITLLRLRALMARTCSDDDTYRVLVDRYRTMAGTLGFDGHIAWAETMAARAASDCRSTRQSGDDAAARLPGLSGRAGLN